jgi:hypothetical protein
MSCKILKPVLIPALVLALVGCGGEGDGSGAQPPAQDSLDTATANAERGLVKVGGHLFAVPSPVEMALLNRKLDLPYRKDLPMPTSAADRLTTKGQRALYMGMCGADLAYVTIHKDGQRALTILRSVQSVSAALELSNAFDQGLLDRFKRSLNSEDSLLRMSGLAYRAADQYLKQSERHDVSALVLAGGWLEGMYLTLAGGGERPAAELVSRVGEQKRTLDNIIVLLESTDTEKAQGALIAGLKDLATAFQGVAATYQYQQPTVDAAKKTTYINSTSTVTVPPEVLRTITEKVTALRTTISA